VRSSIPVILPVEAVAFRLRIRIDEKGKVKGPEGFTQPEAPDIFNQLILNPCAFRDFMMEHFEQAYSSFLCTECSQSRLTCCLVHATAAINGKGNESIIVAEWGCFTGFGLKLSPFSWFPSAHSISAFVTHGMVRSFLCVCKYCLL
jgi:hypothetical protein